MKKTAFVLFVTAFTIYCFSYWNISKTESNNVISDKNQMNYSEIAPDNEVQSTTSAPYIIRESAGKIIIEHEGLITVTDISVFSMRDADRKRFNEGVAVFSKDEVLKLLEDFES